MNNGTANITNITKTVNTTNELYNETFDDFIDGNYTLGVTCANETKNKDITLDDITSPTILTSFVESISSEKATISSTFNERSYFTVFYGTTSYNLTRNITGEKRRYAESLLLQGLYADTRHYYNTTVCDWKGNCNSTGLNSFKTEFNIQRRITAQEAGVMLLESNVESTDARIWSAITAEQVLTYRPKNVAISKVELYFAKAANTIELIIEQYRSKPVTIPDASGIIYKYLDVEHKNIEENVQSYNIEISVTKGWAQTNNIDVRKMQIARLENGAWTQYPLHFKAELLHEYVFKTTIPGFSYFAITGTVSPAPPVPAPEPLTPLEEHLREQALQEQAAQQAVQTMQAQNESLTNVEQNTTAQNITNDQQLTGFAIATDPKTKDTFWIMWASLVIIMTSITISYQYQQKEEKKKDTIKETAKDQTTQQEITKEKQTMNITQTNEQQNTTIVEASNHDSDIELLKMMIHNTTNKAVTNTIQENNVKKEQTMQQRTTQQTMRQPVQQILASRQAVTSQAAVTSQNAQQTSLSQPVSQILSQTPALNSFHQYIDAMRTLGYNDNEIKQNLVKNGWDVVTVEIEMMMRR